MTQASRTLRVLVVAVGLLLLRPALALEPSEIALVVARSNKDSLGLAEYYCGQRGVPADQIVEVDLPPEETIEREQWRWSVRPEIRKWLLENDPDRKIRCLVTTWGVPLRIAKQTNEDGDGRYLDYLKKEKSARLERLEQIATVLDKVAGGTAVGEALASIPSEQGRTGLQDVKERLEAALRGAQTRLSQMPPDQRGQQNAQVQQLATIAGGGRVLLQGMQQQIQGIQAADADVPDGLRDQFNVLRGRASAFNELRLLLDSRPPGFDRDELALRMLEQTGGLLACVEWIDRQISAATKAETGASFDSELSLVLWPDGYELLRWQPNYLRGAYGGSQLTEAFPTLMVARIDGPDLPTAKRLIDDAIAVEKAGGLAGKVYLDARGLAELEGPPHEPGSYPDFDRSLLATAKGLEAITDASGDARFDVVLNELPELFAPGQCPDAALYCGWYSLAKYVDAFDWNQGAVAYHLASAEATTLKEIDSQAWCRKLLQDGVCATIGPVYEPYLLAFPRPNEFFALLVQGEEPLVEVYYRTKPFNSWMMTLIGDPLYRPFVAPPANSE